MEARHVWALRDERSDRPGAANTRLKALEALLVWACEEKPEFGSAKSSAQDQVRDTATIQPGEITQYRNRHPIGSKARLAFDLLPLHGWPS